MNVGVGVTRLSASGENIDLLKNALFHKVLKLEFMQGNKVVLQAGDCVRVNSDTNTSVDAGSHNHGDYLMAFTKITNGLVLV